MTRRFTKDEFIDLARQIHGDRYDYSSVTYVNMSTKVRIICKDHGEFLQVPYTHTLSCGKPSGCPSCAGNKRLSTEQFIDRAKKIHGSLYDYIDVKYVNAYTKVKIRCKIHGEFLQTPINHLSGNLNKGSGCLDCSGKKQSNTVRFIESARRKHGDLYNYDLVSYVNKSSKVTIVCKDHGSFLQRPNDHLTGYGCPVCCPGGYSPLKPGTLYYVRFDLPSLTLWKIGITNRKVLKRFAGFKTKPVILWQHRWEDGHIAAREEKRILTGGLYDQYRYTGDPLLESGNTECFTIDIMQLGNVTRVAQASA